jgi:MFS family permease
MGALGDRFGRARVLQLGLLVFGGASIAATFATTAEQLIAARAVMGIGAAMMMPSTLSILINVFPRDERGRAIAAWSGIMGLGIGLGPVVGGFLIENFDWAAVFLINVPVALAALLLGLVLVPDSRDPSPARIDLPGAALSISGVSVLVYAIIDAPRTGWTDPFILGMFAAALLLLVVFVWWELRTSHPMLDFSLFRNRRMTAGVTAIGANFFGLFAVIFGLTQFLQFVLGLTPLEAGAVMLPLAIGIPMGAGLSVRLVGRLGTARVVAGALVAVAIVILTVTEGRAGVGSAVNVLVGQLAGALGVAVVGSVMNSVYADQMAEVVGQLPAQVAGPASDSVGAALAIAAQLPGALGDALATAARNGFVDALGAGAIVAAVAILIGALAVGRFMPPRHLPTT